MELSTPIQFVPGTGPIMAGKLSKLNISTVGDLVNHIPFRFNDFSTTLNISQVKVGETVTTQGQVWSIKTTYTRSRKVLTTAILNDGTGSIVLTWFNQPFIAKSLKSGDLLQVSGKIARYGSKVSILMPVWEKLDSLGVSSSNSLHTGRLVPVYPETEGVSSKWLRSKIDLVLPKILSQIEDIIPPEVKQDRVDLKLAYEKIHFPQNLTEFNQAWQRLAFDELFWIQLETQKRKIEWQEKKITQSFNIDIQAVEKFINSLPFALTTAQHKVISEIMGDLQKTHPMNRLVQGDVGSGKTIVATVIAYLAHLNNLKSVIMAPTEILAFQHFQTMTRFLTPYKMKIGIYTGSKKFTKEDNVIPDIYVGTHALLSEKLELNNIGLVVVDEQQRFGVEQRSILRSKTSSPHFLTMTATPIPRTVALTLYGDLDLSIINELPKGRKIIKTYFVPQKKRADAYKFISQEVQNGRQIYIITPLIEESETLISAKAAKVEFERLKKEIFPKFKIGLLHGKLKPKEKESVINEFKDHKIDILVSTSVVEVGVDVPNATVMVIEGAERFGLAQLHQLRGRVGRGEYQSYDFLFAENENPPTVNRLKNLEKIHDGLVLSELDLKIRGSGEVFGTKQSGDWSLKIASFSDLGLIEEARNAASKILREDPKLDKYPKLSRKLQQSGVVVMPD